MQTYHLKEHKFNGSILTDKGHKEHYHVAVRVSDSPTASHIEYGDIQFMFYVDAFDMETPLFLVKLYTTETDPLSHSPILLNTGACWMVVVDFNQVELQCGHLTHIHAISNIENTFIIWPCEGLHDIGI